MPELTFAVGDIHGMYNEFLALMNAIEGYAYKAKVSDYKIVFLGDYIDRGYGSAQVVQHLINENHKHPDRFHFGRGNHEEMLMDAWSGGYDDIGHFVRNGGDTTLYSYRVDNPKEIPFSHKQFYKDTKFFYEDRYRFYVHAGINPLRALDNQDTHSMLWIRELFLQYQGVFPKLIVHGHTPRLYDVNLSSTNRLNLDFGCVFGGKLVAAVFNNNDVDPENFIQVGSAGRNIVPDKNNDF